MEPIEIVTEKLRGIAATAIALAPQILLALLLLVVTWAVARAATSISRRAMKRTHMRESLTDLFGRLIAIAIWIVGLLIAATILFPNLTPAKMLAALGLGSIAIGLAFKDIFENFLAGILIMLREPMRIGDFVECEGVDGNVEKITIRDTYIRRTDGQLVLVPNAMLFKNPVYVATDRDIRRTRIICGVAYDEDIDESRAVIRAAVESVDAVETDRPIQIYAKEFADSSINFEVVWWTGSRPGDIRKCRDKVVAAIKRALDEAGIEIPFPYRTLTFKESLSLDRTRDEKRAPAGEPEGSTAG